MTWFMDTNFLHLVKQTFSWWLLFSCMWQHADTQNNTSVSEIPSTCKGQQMKAADSASSSSSFSSSIRSQWGPRRQCAQAMTTFLILHQFVWHFVTSVNKNNKILHYNPLPAVHNNLCQVTQLCKMKMLHVQQRCLHGLLRTTWWRSEGIPPHILNPGTRQTFPHHGWYVTKMIKNAMKYNLTCPRP